MEPAPYTLSENTCVQPVKLLNRNLVGVMDLCPGDAAASVRCFWNPCGIRPIPTRGHRPSNLLWRGGYR
jgi:hypothetical protein